MWNVGPAASARAHLQPTGRILGAQDREDAVVRMCTGPELTRRGRHRLLRVVDDPQRREVALKLVLEVIRLESDGSGEDASQRRREFRHRPVVIPPSGLQIRRVRRPSIAPESGSEVQGLLQIADGPIAERCSQRLLAEREVHQPAHDRAGLADGALLLGGQVEEGPRGIVDARDQGLGDAVTGYHEEADVLAGGADIVHDANLSGSLPGCKRGDIDGRDGAPPVPAERHPD